jgi:hypothetical protein
LGILSINQEESMRIIKVVILLLISLSANAFDIEKSITGSWFDQENPGQGINIEILSGNRTLVYWYAYDQGKPLWLTGTGTYQGDTSVVELSSFDGSNFGVDHDQNLVSSQDFGSITLTFDSCNTGKMTYDSIQGLGSGTINLNRLTEIEGLPCATTEPPVSASSCTNFAAGSPFCDQGVSPTCSFTQAHKSQIVIGMTYDEVVNIIGCHGVFVTRTEIQATYSWSPEDVNRVNNRGSVSFILEGSTPRVITVL